MTSSKSFTVIGITKHTSGNVSLEKVRYGTDKIRVIKMLNNPTKIWHTESKQHLAPVRVDMIDLPYPMLKLDALKFLAQHPDFQSPDDQATIHDEIEARTPKQPRVKKSKTTVDSIKSRSKANVSVDQILAAVA